jgi:hypothetical protein
MYGGEMCRSLYGHDPQYITEGDNFGLYRRETPIVQRELLEAVHGKVRLGLLTGRSDAETQLALRTLGLQLPTEALLTSSSGLKKPDGKTMLQLRDQMEFKAALYVGDTLDDLRTVQNYRELRGAGKSRVYSAIALVGAGRRRRATTVPRGGRRSRRAGREHDPGIFRGGAEVKRLWPCVLLAALVGCAAPPPKRRAKQLMSRWLHAKRKLRGSPSPPKTLLECAGCGCKNGGSAIKTCSSRR